MQDDETISRLETLAPYCKFLGVGLLLTDGQYASGDLLHHCVPQAFRDGILDLLKWSSLTSPQVTELRNEYDASKKDLQALIVQQNLSVELNPWRLSRKRKGIEQTDAAVENRRA